MKMTQRRVLFTPRGARSIVFTFIPFLITAAAIAQAPADGAKTEARTAATSPAASNTTANPGRPGGTGGFISGRGPAALPAGVKAERNIPYAENGHHNQVLDPFLPEQSPDKPCNYAYALKISGLKLK